jgi:CubicO group peptidase (beta-lactamase class C family)
MKVPQRLLPLVLLLVFLNQIALSGPSAPPANLNPQPNVIAALDDYFEKAAGLGFSGAVLAVKDDKVLLRNGYGWADEKRRIAIRPEMVFDIGSITKVFTAVAIMQLEERGKLSTSDSITKYFSNVPPDKKPITLHHLLTHTSGLGHDDFYAEASAETNMTIFMRKLRRRPKRYSSTGKSSFSAFSVFLWLLRRAQIVSIPIPDSVFWRL